MKNGVSRIHHFYLAHCLDKKALARITCRMYSDYLSYLFRLPVVFIPITCRIYSDDLSYLFRLTVITWDCHKISTFLLLLGQHFYHDSASGERSRGISGRSLYRISVRIFLDPGWVRLKHRPMARPVFAPELGKWVSSREWPKKTNKIKFSE